MRQLCFQFVLVFALTTNLCACSWALAPVAFGTLSSRRELLLQQTLLATSGVLWKTPAAAAAAVTTKEEDPRRTVTVRLESSADSLGVRVIDTQLRGRNVVAIQRVVLDQKNPQLREGMILKDYPSAQALAERIRSGPFPVDLEFINLAAGGDAFSDLGTTIVTPKDALELAQKTDGSAQLQQQQQPQNQANSYSITTLSKPPSRCAIQTRRGDLLEIDYEAAYRTKDGRTVTFDASSFRGTGQPYQMVLGSGDMIPGVDQGLYEMCPGEVRSLKIPPILGYGSRATQLFRIPPDYASLEWKIELVSIDGNIRQDNNVQTREEREARALY